MAEEEKVKEENELKREEVRGLFTLGLMAILVSYRLGKYDPNVIVLGTSFTLTPFIDVTLATWSLYAFFMVFGLSTDLLGKDTANNFRFISKLCLAVSKPLTKLI